MKKFVKQSGFAAEHAISQSEKIIKLKAENEQLTARIKEFKDGALQVVADSNKLQLEATTQIKELKESLKIAIGYIENPGSRTLVGQLEDIKTGHY